MNLDSPPSNRNYNEFSQNDIEEGNSFLDLTKFTYESSKFNSKRKSQHSASLTSPESHYDQLDSHREFNHPLIHQAQYHGKSPSFSGIKIDRTDFESQKRPSRVIQKVGRQRGGRISEVDVDLEFSDTFLLNSDSKYFSNEAVQRKRASRIEYSPDTSQNHQRINPNHHNECSEQLLKYPRKPEKSTALPENYNSNSKMNSRSKNRKWERKNGQRRNIITSKFNIDEEEIQNVSNNSNSFLQNSQKRQNTKKVLIPEPYIEKMAEVIKNLPIDPLFQLLKDSPVTSEFTDQRIIELLGQSIREIDVDMAQKHAQVVAKFNKKLKNSAKDFELMGTKYKQAASKLREKEAELQQFQKQDGEKSTVISKLKEAHSSSIRKMESELESKDQKISQLQDKFKENQKEHEQRMNDVREKMKQLELSNLDRQSNKENSWNQIKEELKSRVKEAESSVSKLKNHNKALEESLQSKQASISLLEKDKESILKDLASKNREIKSLRIQLDDFKDIAQHAESNTNIQIKQLQEKISYLQKLQNVHKLESSLTQVQLNQQKMQIQSQMESSVHQDVKNSPEPEPREHYSQNGKLGDQVLNEMVKKFQQMKTFNDELIEKLEDLQHENKNVKEVKNGFKQQMILLEEKLAAERTSKHGYEMELIQIQRERAEQIRMKEDLTQSNHHLTTQVQYLQQELEKCTEEAKNFKRKCCDLERNIELSQFTSNTNAKSSEDTILKLKSQINELHKTHQNTKNQYEIHLQNLQGENGEQCRLINELQQNVRNLQQEISNLTISKENLEQKLDFFKGELYNSQLKSNKKALSNQSSEIIKTKLFNLAAKVQQLKKALKMITLENQAIHSQMKDFVTSLALEQLRISLVIQKEGSTGPSNFKDLTFNPSGKKHQPVIRIFEEVKSTSSNFNFMDSSSGIEQVTPKKQRKKYPTTSRNSRSAISISKDSLKKHKKDLSTFAEEREQQRVRLGLDSIEEPRIAQSPNIKKKIFTKFLLNSCDSDSRSTSNRYSALRRGRNILYSKEKNSKKSTPDFYSDLGKEDKENLSWMANRLSLIESRQSPKFNSESKTVQERGRDDIRSDYSLKYQSELTMAPDLRVKVHRRKPSNFESNFKQKQVEYLSSLETEVNSQVDYFSRKMEKLRLREMELREKRFS